MLVVSVRLSAHEHCAIEFRARSIAKCQEQTPDIALLQAPLLSSSAHASVCSFKVNRSNLPGAQAAPSQRHPPYLPIVMISASLLALSLCPCERLSTSHLSWLKSNTQSPAQCTMLSLPARWQCKFFSLPTTDILHNDPDALCRVSSLVSALSFRPLSAPSCSALLLYPCEGLLSSLFQPAL